MPKLKPTLNLSDPVTKLPRVRPMVAKRLKNLGVETIRDLLFHLPSRYDDFSHVTNIAELEAGETASVQGEVVSIRLQRTWKKRMTVVEALVADGTGSVRAVWFNQPYLADTLRQGYTVNLSGKVSLDQRGLVFSHPSHEVIRGSRIEKAEADVLHTGRLVPVYPETAGLTSRWLRFLIQPLVKAAGDTPDPLPAETLARHNLLGLGEALRSVHFPTRLDEAEQGRRRLAFEELLLIQLAHLKARAKVKSFSAPAIPTNLEVVKRFVASLPFQLTDAQRKATWEILQDIAKPHPMARLLEGDVGSGKTAVAAIAALVASSARVQTAFMAPTEILARQHFQTLTALLAGESVSVGLLTGSQALLAQQGNAAAMSRSRLLTNITAGLVDIAVGTHALIQKHVRFPSLGLVVVDEQHRFGVEQRSALIRRHAQTETQTNAEETLLYEALTYEIRKCVFAVRQNLELGHKETVYQKSLAEEFGNVGLRFEKEKPIQITYRGKAVGVYQPDFVVDDKVIIELKALPFIGVTERKQIWHYLKGSPYRLALLVNFASRDVEITRIVYDTARGQRDPSAELRGPDADLRGRNGRRLSALSQRVSALETRQSALVPHLLSMTATPIPRTLALAVFGDLDLSILDELPKGRRPIETRLVAPAERPDAYRFIRDEVRRGRQAFVICPRIDPSADLRGPDADLRGRNGRRLSALSQRASALETRQSALALWEIKAVIDEHHRLSHEVFPDLAVGMLHGKLPAREKAAVMGRFANGELDILVSTSVVEVGVDVPNATVMLIEGADRFGLAQLYQFRGRVGRAEHQSYCLLCTDSPARAAHRRLKAIIEAKSGFELAEQDLKIRGPGDFLGTRQSGLPDLAMASLTDGRLIKAARTEAELLLGKDTTLTTWPALQQRLAEFQAKAHLE